MGIDPISSITDLAGNILDKLFPDKAERDKHKLALLALQQRGELIDIEKRYEAIVAEAKSSDPWTSRARPTFMYVFYVVLLMAIPIAIVAVFSQQTATAIVEMLGMYYASIPEIMWNTFLMGFLGYSAFRTADKGGLAAGIATRISNGKKKE